MNHITKITELQEKIQANKNEVIRLQEREKTVKEEKQKLLAELKTFGIDEQDLEKILKEKETLLETAIKEIENELK
jgi:DNA-binding transcriptional regulator YhcF (GntR family)